MLQNVKLFLKQTVELKSLSKHNLCSFQRSFNSPLNFFYRPLGQVLNNNWWLYTFHFHSCRSCPWANRQKIVNGVEIVKNETCVTMQHFLLFMFNVKPRTYVAERNRLYIGTCRYRVVSVQGLSFKLCIQNKVQSKLYVEYLRYLQST